MRFGCVLGLAVATVRLVCGRAEWRTYLGAPVGTRYSPLADINSTNVANLKIAWTYDTGEPGGAEVTPIQVGGMVYFSTPKEVVVALDPDSGREVWRFDPKIARS